MKYQVTPAFDRDFARLKPEHRKTFKDVVSTKFAPACDAWLEATTAGQVYSWPASLRVSKLVGTHGIYELTWSFASPDGRATFEFVQQETEWLCRWRRVGDHDVFSSP